MRSEGTASAVGRVAWRRYTLITAPALGLAAVMITLAGQGAVAASFAVSGSAFKLSADKLEGTGFVSYGQVDTSSDGKPHAVNQSGFASAELHNLCQSVVSPTPFGTMTMRLTAGKSAPVKATNMVADFDQLSGSITFSGYANGVDAAQVRGGPSTGNKGDWAQQAKTAHIDDLRQNTWATTAGTFELTGLTIDVSLGKHECF